MTKLLSNIIPIAIESTAQSRILLSSSFDRDNCLQVIVSSPPFEVKDEVIPVQKAITFNSFDPISTTQDREAWILLMNQNLSEEDVVKINKLLS